MQCRVQRDHHPKGRDHHPIGCFLRRQTAWSVCSWRWLGSFVSSVGRPAFFEHTRVYKGFLFLPSNSSHLSGVSSHLDVRFLPHMLHCSRRRCVGFARYSFRAGRSPRKKEKDASENNAIVAGIPHCDFVALGRASGASAIQLHNEWRHDHYQRLLRHGCRTRK